MRGVHHTPGPGEAELANLVARVGGDYRHAASA